MQLLVLTQTTSLFVSSYDIASAKGVSRSFAFGANGASQEHRPQATTSHTTSHVKTQTTLEAFQRVPRECKGNWKLLELIIPFEINNRLIDGPDMCVATMGTRVEEMTRCSKKRHPRLNAVKFTVDAVRSCASSCDYSSLPNHVERLIQDVMCPLHQTVSLRRNTKSPRMDALRKLINGLPQCQESMVLIIKKWLQAIIKITTPVSLQPIGPGISSPSPSPSPSPLSLTKFTPYHAKSNNGGEVSQALAAKACKPLTKADRKDGFIYMFWDQQTFGMIKIGRTIDLVQRLKQWNAQCKTTHHYHRTPQDGEPLKIPHVKRIEALMHIELSDYRKKRVCDGCGRTHIEWFDISAEKARKVYQKWQDWIMQKPYAQDIAGNWVVRPEMLGSLSQVCRPVVFPEAAKVVRPRLSVPTTRSKPRRSLGSK